MLYACVIMIDKISQRYIEIKKANIEITMKQDIIIEKWIRNQDKFQLSFVKFIHDIDIISKRRGWKDILFCQ